MDVICGFRSDLSITRKTDGNFGNVSVGVLFSKFVYERKRWQYVLDNIETVDRIKYANFQLSYFSSDSSFIR